MRDKKNSFPEGDSFQRTEQLERELAELRRSEAKYRQLVHVSNDAIYLRYNRKFEIINKKFGEMFGVTLDDVNHPDFDFIELVAPESRSLIEERERKRAQGEPVPPRYEFVALSRDGRELEVETSISEVEYMGGIAIQGVVRDVTERRSLERQLRQAQKIEAISRLAGGIAHDFNNILAIIRGYSELSLDDLEEGSTLHRNLHHILDASDRAKELVNQILTFSRQREEDRQAVNVPGIIREVLNILRPSIPGNIEVRENIDEEKGMIMADPTQIRRVMTNLCANASQAMQENGGVLDISLKRVELPIGGGAVSKELKDLPPGSYLRLSVTDTGPGIAEDIADRIFDPYFTTRITGDGSGMGLAVILGIIKNYGGDIEVKSESGKGASFHLYLPLVTETAVAGKGVEQVQKGKERILFVDDEEMLVYMQQEILERLGYDVVAVSNSSEALDIFKEDPEIFDLVITDQSMPGMTGIRLAKELMKIKPEIPIILCTGFSESVTRQDALASGIKEFIMKPVIKREIAGVIRKVLNRKEMEE